MKKLLLLVYAVLYIHEIFCNTIAGRDSLRPNLNRNSLYVGMKTGLGTGVTTSPVEMGLSYSLTPEIEYFPLRNFSVFAGVNYSHSNLMGGNSDQLSSNWGIKKYFSINQRHSINVSLAMHQGRETYTRAESPWLNYNSYGSNFTVGIGYQFTPVKLFHRTNRHWALYVDMAYPINSWRGFTFTNSGIGVKYLLDKR